VIPSVNVITFSEREEESAEFNNMYSLRSPSPSLHRRMMSDPSHRVTERVLVCLLKCFKLRSVSTTSTKEVENHLLSMVLEGLCARLFARHEIQVWCMGVRSPVLSDESPSS